MRDVSVPDVQVKAEELEDGQALKAKMERGEDGPSRIGGRVRTEKVVVENQERGESMKTWLNGKSS